MAPAREIYRVKWNNFTGVLRTNLRRYLREEAFSDVTLACEGQTIKCHRMLLCACSEYFDTLLNSEQFPPGTNTIIYLKDVKFWELKILIEYIYNGEITINEEKLRRVSAVAESLKIKGFAGEEGVIDEDIARDLQLANARINTGGNKGQQGTQQQNNALKRRAPQSAVPPKLIKIQKSDGQQAANGLANKVKTGGAKEGASQNETGPRVVKLEEGGGEVTVKGESEDDDGLIIEELQSGYDMEMEPADNSMENPSYTDEEEVGDEDDGLVVSIQQAPPVIPPRRKSVYKYSQEVRDSVLSAIASGLTLRQCSESFSIPRKTISKWRQREAEEMQIQAMEAQAAQAAAGMQQETSYADEDLDDSGLQFKKRGAPVSGDSSDRAERLEAAMKLALSGTTVRQAAVTYDIPRTTLCAYMKRKGVTTGGSSLLKKQGGSSAVDDFPFLGLSDLIDDVDGQAEFGEEEEEELY